MSAPSHCLPQEAAHHPSPPEACRFHCPSGALLRSSQHQEVESPEAWHRSCLLHREHSYQEYSGASPLLIWGLSCPQYPLLPPEACLCQDKVVKNYSIHIQNPAITSLLDNLRRSPLRGKRLDAQFSGRTHYDGLLTRIAGIIYIGTTHRQSSPSPV